MSRPNARPGTTGLLPRRRPHHPNGVSIPPRLGVVIAVAAAVGTALMGLHTAPAGAEDGSSAPAGPTTSIASSSTSALARASNPVTPGAFTGLGFDQCLAPTQAKMDTWLAHSPFRAVGIYISGASRGCRDQPNLTPEWISTQLASGWHLLPITLGPQAACNPSFPRYGNDPVINTKATSAGEYKKAFAQGVAEADSAVAAATALGIVPGSTLYYDLEGFNSGQVSCRESSLWFLSAWTQQLHARGFVSGVYSSAGSGIKMLDDARLLRPGVFALPDQIWIARWDGQANTSTTYIAEDGWPGNRIKQFQGGHDETWGGVTINIDRNYLALAGTTTIGAGPTAAPGTTRCQGTPVDLADYRKIKRPSAGGTAPDPTLVSALKCLLKERGIYRGQLKGTWTHRLTNAVHTWQKRKGFKRSETFSRRAWMTLLAAGPTPTLNAGAGGEKVRRVQRALNAASRSTGLTISGVLDAPTQAALKTWQSGAGLPVTGAVSAADWGALQTGKR